LGFRN